MKRDAIIVGAVAIAILPLALWMILRVISRSLDIRPTLQGLRATGWVTGLATTVLGLAACLSERYVSLLPLVAACLIGDIGWYLAAQWVKKQWPTIEGRIDSVTQDGTQSSVTYSFELGSDSFGGMTMMKAGRTPHVAGERVIIAYDPVNPDESTLLERTPI